ncbi:hypothetical protein [Streptomyces europaeiscabiei]|uniref:hypothetical protein n=1 Tax=Streptomyces europaeiscabiei TaxID=146819 RepID=UPI002E2B9385|nr:hypothetical protein [Streptomyces europaeiscabiei]
MDPRAQVLGGLRGNRRMPVLTRLVDGSYLSVIGTVKVRVIDAQNAVNCANDTSFTGSYRLVTPRTDARRHPATALVGLQSVLDGCERRIRCKDPRVPEWLVDPVFAEQAFRALALPFELHPQWQDARLPGSRQRLSGRAEGR